MIIQGLRCSTDEGNLYSDIATRLRMVALLLAASPTEIANKTSAWLARLHLQQECAADGSMVCCEVLILRRFSSYALSFSR